MSFIPLPIIVAGLLWVSFFTTGCRLKGKNCSSAEDSTAAASVALQAVPAIDTGSDSLLQQVELPDAFSQDEAPARYEEEVVKPEPTVNQIRIRDSISPLFNEYPSPILIYGPLPPYSPDRDTVFAESLITVYRQICSYGKPRLFQAVEEYEPEIDTAVVKMFPPTSPSVSFKKNRWRFIAGVDRSVPALGPSDVFDENSIFYNNDGVWTIGSYEIMPDCS